jgi:hypothetical protein
VNINMTGRKRAEVEAEAEAKATANIYLLLTLRDCCACLFFRRIRSFPQNNTFGEIEG